MASDYFSRADFYRRSAQWLRARAADYKLEEIKERFERVAKSYEAGAEEVERRLSGRWAATNSDKLRTGKRISLPSTRIGHWSKKSAPSRKAK